MRLLLNQLLATNSTQWSVVAGNEASCQAAYEAPLIAPLIRKTRLQTENLSFLQIPKVLANADVLVKCQIQLSHVIQQANEAS